MKLPSEFAGLTLPELLDRLAPIPEPPPISRLPQTQGCLLLLGIIALLGLWLGLRWLRRWRANAYRRAALSELRLIGASPVGLAQLLRRTALVAYPREQVAGLAGEDWLTFLDEALGRTAFRSDLGRSLLASVYSGAPLASPAEVVSLVRGWLRDHRSSFEGFQGKGG